MRPGKWAARQKRPPERETTRGQEQTLARAERLHATHKTPAIATRSLRGLARRWRGQRAADQPARGCSEVLRGVGRLLSEETFPSEGVGKEEKKMGLLGEQGKLQNAGNSTASRPEGRCTYDRRCGGRYANTHSARRQDAMTLGCTYEVLYDMLLSCKVLLVCQGR